LETPNLFLILEEIIKVITMKNSEYKVTIDEYTSSTTSEEMVKHPTHYGGEANTYEAIKVIEAWELDRDFYLGNVVKYISRAGKKGSKLQDLEKALWYLQRRIDSLK
jgi:hypothetical protein